MGFLDGLGSTLGQGLRDAGGILSPEVYDQQNKERMQQQQFNQALKVNLAGQVIKGVEEGAITPEAGQQHLASLGINFGGFGATPAAQQNQVKLQNMKAMSALIQSQMGGQPQQPSDQTTMPDGGGLGGSTANSFGATTGTTFGSPAPTASAPNASGNVFNSRGGAANFEQLLALASMEPGAINAANKFKFPDPVALREGDLVDPSTGRVVYSNPKRTPNTYYTQPTAANPQGIITPIPGASQAVQENAAAAAGGEAQFKLGTPPVLPSGAKGMPSSIYAQLTNNGNPNGISEISPQTAARAKSLNEQQETADAAAKSSQMTLDNAKIALDAINTGKFTTGTLAAAKASVSATLQGWGMDTSKINGFDSATDFQTFEKAVTGAITSGAKTAFGGRVAVQELEFLKKAYASSAGTGDATRRILAVMIGQANRDQDLQRTLSYYSAPTSSSGGSTEGVEAKFNQTHPLTDYVQKAYVQTRQPTKPQVFTPPGQTALPTGLPQGSVPVGSHSSGQQAYQLPNGKIVVPQ